VVIERAAPATEKGKAAAEAMAKGKAVTARRGMIVGRSGHNSVLTTEESTTEDREKGSEFRMRRMDINSIIPP
jgi:hypothetical protein